MKTDISAFEHEFIRQARQKLETPTLLIRAANLAGKPLAAGLDRLPNKLTQMIANATQKALQTGLIGALRTLPKNQGARDLSKADARSKRSGRYHTWLATGTGVAAGLFGGLAFPLELATTTTLILRSIAAIAAENGMDLDDPEVRAECLYVLTLGTTAPVAEGVGAVAMESSYLGSRLAFSGLIKNAAAFMAGKSTEEIALVLQKKSAPVLVRLLGEVAKRFEIVAAEKFLGQIVPIAAAVGGGAINALFADYYADMARYHFGLRALEQKHGADVVQKIYRQS